jgi:predicted RNase H-like nuclease (RuvC/YqgF family)
MDVENIYIRPEIEQAIEGVEMPDDDSDTAFEDEIINGSHADDILNTKDDEAVIQTPGGAQNHSTNLAYMTPDQEHLYIQQMKGEWDKQYEAKISKKDERLSTLKNVVMEQDSFISEMKKKLKTIDEKHEKEYQEGIKRMKKYMKEWAKNVSYYYNLILII